MCVSSPLHSLTFSLSATHLLLNKTMLEESLPSIWASMHGWFTPAVLFVLLNLVIGTIALTSKGIRAHHGDDGDHHHPDDHRRLTRSPSTVLERIRSFNLSRYRSDDIPLETTPAPTTETLEMHHAPPDPAAEEHHFVRSQSDAHPTAGEMPAKLAGKIKKSASATSPFAHFEEAEIVERTETARDGDWTVEGEEEVDARADDFINRFKQQLKLQRLDSILRYKEMLNGGK